jgi:phage-related protein
MKNFADIADDLGGAFEGMTEEQKLAELGALGFSKQARAGVLMLSGQGDKIRDYESALRDAAGFTADVATKQLATPAAQFALLGSAFENLALEIGSVLAPALGNMAGLLAPLITDLLPGITNVLETSVVPAVESFTRVFTDTAVGLLEGSLTIEEIFRDLFDKIIGFFTGDGLTKLLKGFVEVRATIIDAFIKVIPMVVDAIIRILPAIVQTLADMIPELLDTAVETFMALVDAVVLVLPNIINALLLLLPQLLETVIGMLPDLIEASLELFTGIVTALIEVIPNIIETLIDAMPRITDALIDALPLIIEAAFKLFTGIITALLRAWPDVIASLIGLFPKLIGAILGQIPKMVDAGFQLISGLARGLMDSIPRLLGEAASAIGNALTNGVKAVFQIRSPSRVFMDIGENVVTGLEQGITDNLRMLENASLGMTSTVTATAENGFGDMSAPILMSGSSQAGRGSTTFQITVNAGMGADGGRIGQQIVDEIKRFERANGAVFASA